MGDEQEAGAPALRDRWLLGFAVLGLALRIVYALTAHLWLVGDEIQYEQLGHNFRSYWGPGASSHVFWGTGSLIRPPGYPLFLAMNYNLGLGDGAVRVEQALMVSAACLLLSVLVARTVGLTAGRFTSLAGAVFPPLITVSSPILSESLAGLLCAGSIALLVRAWGSSDFARFARRLAGASLLAAAATLVHPNVVVIFVVVAGVALFGRRVRRERAIAFAVACVAALFLFAPWMARNFAVAGSLTPLAKNEANSAQIAAGVHFPVYEAAGEFGAYRRSLYYFSGSSPGLTRARALSRPLTVTTAPLVNARRALVHNVTHQPLKQIETSLFWQKELWLIAFDDHTQYGHQPVIPWLLSESLHIIFLAFALIGAWFTRRLILTRLVLLFALVIALPYLLVVPSPRYAIPAVLMLVTLAGVGAAIAVDWARAAVQRGPTLSQA